MLDSQSFPSIPHVSIWFKIYIPRSNLHSNMVSYFYEMHMIRLNGR